MNVSLVDQLWYLEQGTPCEKKANLGTPGWFFQLRDTTAFAVSGIWGKNPTRNGIQTFSAYWRGKLNQPSFRNVENR
ncbi:MAG: hypothetical protein AAGJ35_14500, partial [Myxococcota bacterium]